MKITEEQKSILKKYNISYENFIDIDDLLDKIDEVMMDNYLDEDDEPLPDFLILQKVYDGIYYNNTDEDGYAI